MSFLIIFQNILFSYSHHDKYEFYLYSILLYNKKQENYYIGGIADYVDKKRYSHKFGYCERRVCVVYVDGNLFGEVIHCAEIGRASCRERVFVPV